MVFSADRPDKDPQENKTPEKDKTCAINLIFDFHSEDKQKRERAAETLINFIHFYIRKIRHKGPPRYTKNGKPNLNGLTEYDMDDAVQSVFLHILENTHRLDYEFHEQQLRAYLNKMIESGYKKWNIEHRRLVKVPQKKQVAPREGPLQYYMSLDDKKPNGLCDLKNPEKRLMKEEACRLFEKLFDEFPAKKQRILKHRFVDGMGHDEIGEIFNVTGSRIQQVTGQFIERMRKEDCLSKKTTESLDALREIL